MPALNLEEGRVEQKRRTRQLILEATLRLIQRGQRPTMTDVAEEAQVGRATLYRYFPSLEALLMEAPLDQRTAAADALMWGMEESGAEERAARVQGYLYDLAVEHEAEFRMYLCATMNEWLQRGEEEEEPLRAGRRLAMLDAALAPYRDALRGADFARLRDALAAMVGLESLIVMRDVCGRSAEEGREIMEWAVRTLIAATVSTRRSSSPRAEPD
jgi:AcrR family transcriptional regulator